MRTSVVGSIFAGARLFVTAIIIGGLLNTLPAQTANGQVEARLSPFAPDSDHLWNRLHRALFVRAAVDGSQRVHSTDPLLYRGGTFLLEGESHRRAVALLDEFLASDLSFDDPLKRLGLQRDLWAAFDYAAWYADDWVHHSRHEPAAVALRTRLARAIGRLSLNDRQLAALPDNYALAVESKQYPAEHDGEHPERPWLPPNLFDATGPWVRFHETTAEPMAKQHFDGSGGRAAHIIFMRLPGGRDATEQYLKELGSDSQKQFPPGTMVALVRRALAVDCQGSPLAAPEEAIRPAKVRVTPVTELVQIRVYRRIPADPRANFHGEFGEQDVYEFVLDRSALFSGEHGLRSVGPDERAEPFARSEGDDPFERRGRTDRPPADEPKMPQMKTCTQCHQGPGIHSVTSMQRGLRGPGSELFRTYAWDVELKFTQRAKVRQFNWGLLQGLLEARRETAK